jgi:hypothetical protein
MVFLLPFLAHAQTSKCAITSYDEKEKLIEGRNSDYDPNHIENTVFNVELPSGDYEGEVKLLGNKRHLEIRSKNSDLSVSKKATLSNDTPAVHLASFDGTYIQLMCILSFE